MIKLKDLIPEASGDWQGVGPAWNDKTYKFISKWMIPLSPTVIKRTLGDIKVSTFHGTDVDGIKKLKKLSGKSKSISTFKGIGTDANVFLGFGVQNKGGIIVQVEGTLLANSMMDISTQPDESGRRWISLQSFKLMYGIRVTEKTIFKHYYETKSIKKLMKWFHSLPGKAGGKPTKASIFNIMGSYINDHGKKFKSDFIKDYMDTIENLVWKTNASKIQKHFGKNLGNVVNSSGSSNKSFEWNEIVINKIELKDALIIGNEEDWSSEDWDAAEKVTKSAVTGKVEWSDGPGTDDTGNWIKKRDGVVYSD